MLLRRLPFLVLAGLFSCVEGEPQEGYATPSEAVATMEDPISIAASHAGLQDGRLRFETRKDFEESLSTLALASESQGELALDSFEGKFKAFRSLRRRHTEEKSIPDLDLPLFNALLSESAEIVVEGDLYRFDFSNRSVTVFDEANGRRKDQKAIEFEDNEALHRSSSSLSCKAFITNLVLVQICGSKVRASSKTTIHNSGTCSKYRDEGDEWSGSTSYQSVSKSGSKKTKVYELWVDYCFWESCDYGYSGATSNGSTESSDCSDTE